MNSAVETKTGQDQDRRCLERLGAGEEAALGELYDRHAAFLYSVIRRIVRVRTEAEDVLQEVWVQAWRRAGSYDASRGSVGAWLLTIARSRAIDRLRSLRSRQLAETAASGESEPEPAGSPDVEALSGRVHQRVVSALESLEPRQREALELAYFGGLSQSEIAARLRAPLGTVKSWVRQGLHRLREIVPMEEAT
jgi:RNA polymerase sigma-70 factor (ECF subfamily)